MKLQHIGLAIFGMAIWGFNFVAISVGLKEMPPLLFTCVRFVITAFPLILFVRKPALTWWQIFSIGMTLLTLQFAFLFKGMQLGVGGGVASTVVQSQAFFTLIIAAVMLRERPAKRDLAGLCVAALGIVLIALTMSGASALGVVMIVLAAFFWSIGNVLLKRAGNVDMLALIVYASLFPPIPLFLLSYVFEGPEQISTAVSGVSIASAWALLYIVVGSTLVGYTIWGFLLKNYAATQVAPFGLLVPIFGVFSGWLLMGEEFGAQRLQGAALVFTGLVVINWRTLLPYLRPRIFGDKS
ncbi:MAG: O-acetylserine/cysteine efflux transporter [Halioglobus sp.]